MIDAPHIDTEDRLRAINSSRPELLTSTQHELAAVQHECRKLNEAPHSCEALRNAVSALSACSICLMRAQLQQAHSASPLPQQDLRPAA
jgi:hypothetical protein